jgi:hypothetical protein
MRFFISVTIGEEPVIEDNRLFMKPRKMKGRFIKKNKTSSLPIKLRYEEETLLTGVILGTWQYTNLALLSTD